MSRPNFWTMSASAFLILFSLTSCRGQDSDASAKTPELYFSILPSRQLFSLGEPVIVGLELYSRAEQPILVSRLQNDKFVSFKVTDPDGNQMVWQRLMRIAPEEFGASDFTVLGQYKEVSAKRVISLKDGTGFAFNKLGQYSLTAEFSMGHGQDFTPNAGQAKPAIGSFHSTKLAFCIEACILEPLKVNDNAPQAALDAVRVFYTDITKYPQLGIPSGRTKKAVGPLLSKRLAKQLDDLGACNADYYRRYGEILRARTYKPATPWLEEGLFTGPDDAATPPTFHILSSRIVGESRVDVLVVFKEDWGAVEGNVTAILENRRWVIDDYVAMYGNDELRRLSSGYPECKGGRWVGERPY
jgi:hypothetical protein